MSARLDMTDTIIPKSNQLNADDLIAGPLTVTITKVARANTAEQPIAISFEGDGGKPYFPCKSMRRVMVAVWGADANQYSGRSMTLYRDPKVKWGGMEVGGIRISHMTNMDGALTIALTETSKSKKPFRVLPLVVEAPAMPASSGRTPRQIIEAFEAVQTAQDYYAIIDREGERIAKLRDIKPAVFDQVDAARDAASKRMQDAPVPVDAGLDDEVPA